VTKKRAGEVPKEESARRATLALDDVLGLIDVESAAG
jgi:hypothetical protein